MKEKFFKFFYFFVFQPLGENAPNSVAPKSLNWFYSVLIKSRKNVGMCNSKMSVLIISHFFHKPMYEFQCLVLEWT